MSWEWIMRADGQVFYRLTEVNGRRERNHSTLETRMPAAELGAIGEDKTKATKALDADVHRPVHRLPGDLGRWQQDLTTDQQGRTAGSALALQIADSRPR